jgi:hypothetical protein
MTEIYDVNNEVKGVNDVESLHKYLQGSKQATIRYGDDILRIMHVSAYYSDLKDRDFYIFILNNGMMLSGSWNRILYVIKGMKEDNPDIKGVVYSIVNGDWSNSEADRHARFYLPRK